MSEENTYYLGPAEWAPKGRLVAYSEQDKRPEECIRVSRVMCGGIRDMSFGSLFRQVRLNNKITLREYCRRTNTDSGNHSKIEKNILAPPNSTDKILNMLGDMEYTELDLEFLITAAQNYHIGRVTAKF